MCALYVCIQIWVHHVCLHVRTCVYLYVCACMQVHTYIFNASSQNVTQIMQTQNKTVENQIQNETVENQIQNETIEHQTPKPCT